MKKNDVLIARIEGINNLGFGIAKVEGQVVFVSGAADGDEVEMRIILVRKSYAVARIERLLSPSPYRLSEPFCYASACGGCAYSAITYEREKTFKEESVRYAFIKAGLPDAEILPLLSTSVTRHYRNKAQFAVAPDKNGEVAIGFFAPKSHRLVSAMDCPLQDKSFAPILRTLCDFCHRYHIKPYVEENHGGLLRHIYLRASTKGEVLLTLVLREKSLPHAEKLEALLREKHPEIVGCYLNINPEKTNVICSDDYRLLFGEPYLEDTLAGVRLSLSPASFYQVNHAAAELLYAEAKRLADLQGNESLLDLYAGVGSIGLSMADKVGELVGVEIVPSAVECAKENAKRNGIENASFYCADAGSAEALFAAVKKEKGDAYRPDVVVLDPPRKGCAEELLDYLSHTVMPEKIVYISCNPDTLARDCAYLTKNGYILSPVTPVDLFPRTGHVESVVCLTRSDKAT
ncbi:MAG: 23S rRNA (uracil(1939)-C(5))-methyltransferase RlmD [Clostridia bacterium]|nr:23S rRNA (uracil(1939)-C(5))-methyltransferase RlmD [Clostridia bacterium]